MRSNFDPGDQNSLETEAPAEASIILLGICLLDWIRVGIFFGLRFYLLSLLSFFLFSSFCVHLAGLFSMYRVIFPMDF